MGCGLRLRRTGHNLGASGLVSRRTGATNASVFYTFDKRGNVAQRLGGAGVTTRKHLIYLPCDSPNEYVLQVVEAWMGLWAEAGTEAAFTAIALDEYEVWTPEWLDLALTDYRPLELYPGTNSFKVTSPGAATTPSHVPTQEVKWYNPEKSGLAGDVSFDLPLNGRWSDLLVEFNIWVNDEGNEDCVLALDEVRCWDQYWSEEEKKREREAARL